MIKTKHPLGRISEPNFSQPCLKGGRHTQRSILSLDVSPLSIVDKVSSEMGPMGCAIMSCVLDQLLWEIISELSELSFQTEYMRFTRRESQKHR